MHKDKIFFIAEIGINHNGDLELAKTLIQSAKNCGFDAVKFQKRNIDKVYTRELLDSPRESPWGNTQRAQKEKLEFGDNEYDQINEFCKKIKIEWFASAWDLDSLKFLEKYKLKYNKIASAMIVDLDFLEAVANQGVYTFISTGMTEKINIDNAVKIFREKKCPFELMHCFSTYPMNPQDANLKTIKHLEEEYGCKVGYSGHEKGLAVSFCAALLGATSIERHITLDRSSYGSDQASSLEERGMKELISVINIMQKAIGVNMLGKMIPGEKEIAKKLRAHINKKFL
jgi:N-acetylneuraminate synthase